MERFKKITAKDKINFNEKQVRGHVIVKNGETGEVLLEKDNLVLMRTRVFLFEYLFKNYLEPNNNIYKPDDNYNDDPDRSICLFSIGQGGADVNAAAFNPYTPKFSDRRLSEPVPFVTYNRNKDSDISLSSDPSIISDITEINDHYYLPTTYPDGTIGYFGKKFENDSKGWVIDTNTGEVAYSLTLRITANEARGCMINEIGTYLGKEVNGSFEGVELATRITFDTESLTNLSKTLEIEYIFYI